MTNIQISVPIIGINDENPVAYADQIKDDNLNKFQGEINSEALEKQDRLISGTNIKTINNQSILGSGNISISGDTGVDQIQSDWTQTNTESKDYIKNKPNLSVVATSGNYNDLSGKPTIPTVPTKVSAFTNDKGYLTQHLDISGKVDKVEGKGLSTNDYTNSEKNKLANVYTKTESDSKYTTKETHQSDIDSLADRIIENADSITDLVSNKANTSNVYTKQLTYTKQEVNNLVSTPNQNFVTVDASSEITSVTDILPTEGSNDTIYRVSKWNGIQFDDTCYSEYAWNGSLYIKLSTKYAGIDDTPIAGSVNPVTSGSLSEIIYGEGETQKVTISITAGEAVPSSTYRDVNLDGELLYKINISDTRTNGTELTIISQNSNNEGVPCKFYQINEESVKDITNYGTAYRLLYYVTTIYCYTSAPVSRFRFVTNEENSKDTSDITFEFIKLTDNSIIDRITTLEKNTNSLITQSIKDHESIFGYTIKKENVTLYSPLRYYLYRQIPAGTTVVNKGVPVIFGSDAQLTQRQDVESGETVVTNFDVNHIRSKNTAGNVSIDVIGSGLPANFVSGGSIINSSIGREKLELDIVDALDSSKDIVENITYYPVNLLNVNDNDVQVGKIIYNSNGTLAGNNEYTTTGYIPVIPGRTYYAGYTGSYGNSKQIRFALFYNKNKEPITSSYITSLATNVTAPENASYMRCTLYSSEFENNQISVDKITTYHAYEDPVEEYRLRDDIVFTVNKSNLSDDVSNAVDLAENTLQKVKQESINLLNPNDPDVLVGKYINTSYGTIGPNATYTVTGYIPVIPGKTYYCGYINSSASEKSIRTAIFYDADKDVINSSWLETAVSSLTAPEGSAYMRCTLYAESFNSNQITVDSLKPYEEYFTPYYKYQLKEDLGVGVPNESVSFDKLTENVRAKITPTINHFEESGVVEGGQYLTLPKIHIGKNNVVTCDIDGNISTVSFGLGYSDNSNYEYRDYAALWVTVDSTNITQYRYYNNGYQAKTPVAHGLSLTSSMKLEMVIKLSGSYFRIYDNLGNYYEMSIENDGTGQPFFYNGGDSSLTCKLCDFPMDLKKPIWFFGDSYASFAYQQRWPYYFNEKGYTNWLSNNLPGLGSSAALVNLRNLLSLGVTPDMIVWTLGMNGSYDPSLSQISSNQKADIDYLVSICNDYGIELVLSTVPTVPSRQKHGFSSYVRSLGVRYIDFAKAVGSDASGNWNTGLLSSDNVHPTTAGAKVLASQVMVDCPELTTT